MSALKPFRHIPTDIREWTTWMRQQDDSLTAYINNLIGDAPVTSTSTVTAASNGWDFEFFDDDYAVTGDDTYKFLVSTKATAVTATIPADVFEVGDHVSFYQYGAGQLTIAAGTGVTINTPSTLLINEQYGTVVIVMETPNQWFIAGRMEATAGGSGSVTSVAATVPTGLTVAGSPITSSGTLAVTYTSGYAIPTTAKQTEWDTAYGWGDHASGSYLTAVVASNVNAEASTDGWVLTSDGAGNAAWEAVPAGGGEINDLTAAVIWTDIPIANVPTGTTSVTVALGDHTHAGVYEPIDATLVKDADFASDGILKRTSAGVYGIVTDSSANWNTAYGWGDHSVGGYLTGNETITLSGDVTGSGATAITTTIAEDAVDIAMLSATGTPSASTFLRGDNQWETPAGAGTVTSVAMTVPTGLTISGTPITSNGTLAVTYTAGYAIPTSAKQTEWDAAYTYTNALTATAAEVNLLDLAGLTAGYVLSADTATTASWKAQTAETSHADVVVDGDFASNGILKRTAAGVYGIVTDASANWNTAYGWGDHSAGGYLTAETNDLSAVVTWANVPIANIPTGTTGVTVALGNHTHTGVYEPADATILKDADIGGSVQAYSAVLTATTASFLVADESKLDAIAAGADVTSANETSHADVVVDGDFVSNGILKRTAAGTYGIVTDASANWNTAYGWGDHGAVGYLTSESNNLSAAVTWANIPIANVPTGTTGVTVALGNHTHTGVYEPADATILKDADIGGSVQAWAAVLDGTTASFTTTIAAAVVANTAKVTNANHTGQVTGSGALALDVTAVTAQPASGALTGTDTMIVNDGGVLSEATLTQVKTFTGGGTVTYSGTPLSSEVAVFTGADDLYSHAGFTWDGTTLEATQFAGIAKANLVDKSAEETITRDWTWKNSTDQETYINLDKFSTGSYAGIRFRDESSPADVRWYTGLDDVSTSEYIIKRYNTSGTFQGDALSIDNTNGDVTLENDLTVFGDITVSGDVDGRNVSQDGAAVDQLVDEKRFCMYRGGTTPQSITGTEITMDLTTAEATSGATYFTVSSDRVYIQEPGYYRIRAQVTVDATDTTGGTFADVEVRIQSDNFDTDYGLCHIHVYEGSNASGSCEIIDNFNNDYIRVRLLRTNGTTEIETIPDGCNLIIEHVGTWP